DGENWTSIGPRLWNRVRSIEVFADGSGPALHIPGEPRSIAGGYPAKLSEGAWETVGGGVDRMAAGLTVIDGDLFVSGSFTTAGGQVANGLAIWRCPSCYADCDGSGELDFFDFLCFQNEFAAGAAYADCDDSGALDFFDFLCFQNEFAAGCP